jgi:hypothetical protein
LSEIIVVLYVLAIPVTKGASVVIAAGLLTEAIPNNHTSDEKDKA